MSIVARVLPQVQAISEGEMLDTVTIHHPSSTSQNEYGATVQGTPTDTSTVGRVSPATERDLERIEGGELRQAGLEVLRVPRDTAVEGADSVTIVSARHGTTLNYSVEGIVPLSTLGVHRKVLVRKT